MIIFGVERYIERAYTAGQENERAKIVAWLRADLRDTFTAGDLIEAGEHLK
jgi:hypothetical protein